MIYEHSMPVPSEFASFVGGGSTIQSTEEATLTEKEIQSVVTSSLGSLAHLTTTVIYQESENDAGKPGLRMSIRQRITWTSGQVPPEPLPTIMATMLRAQATESLGHFRAQL